MPFDLSEILETVRMITSQSLDIRTVTMGIDLHSCADSSIDNTADKVYNKITTLARELVQVVDDVQSQYGIPIVNRRVAVTPVANIIAAAGDVSPLPVAKALESAAEEIGIDFIGGYSALVHKGHTRADTNLIESIPEAVALNEKVCSSVNVATTRAGINMDAVYQMGRVIKRCAELTADRGGYGAVKLVVFANAPEDNPFMAGAFHGSGEPETAINVGVSGPGVIRAVVEQLGDINFIELSESIKKAAFKITRAGELVGREVSSRLNVKFGIIDLSLAPTPTQGDSVANILEAMGLERCGAHGTTAALALLNEAVKKGGSFASSSVGGLSGAFIPVSEDLGMVEAVEAGALTLSKLEAMTSVCSVGLDMIALPGDTDVETIAAIIADEMAIGVINNKTTAVRAIPVPGKKAGEWVEFGGLMGKSIIIPVNQFSSHKFIKRGGRIPAPLRSLTN